MKKFKKILTSLMMAVVVMSSATMVFAEEPENTDATEAVEEKVFDPSGTYHAALGIQTCNTAWINRQAYFTDSLNQYYGTDMNDKLWAGDPSAAGNVYEGTFTDIELKGNGTYTVKLEGADFDGETTISQLYVATDIPVNDAIKVTDFKVTINDRVVVTFPEAELEDEDKYNEGGLLILAINHWRKPLVQKLEELGVCEDDTSGIRLLTGTGDDNVYLTFTINGFDYDNEEATEAVETEAETEVQATEAVAEKTDSDNAGGLSTTQIILICVAAAVVVVIVVVVVVSKKKKNN